MKRPLFYGGVILLLSIFVASFLPNNVSFILCFLFILFLPAFYWLFKDKNNVKFILYLIIVSSLGLFLYCFKCVFFFDKLLALDGKDIKVEGTIISYPNYKDKSVYYDVIIDKMSVGNFHKKFKSKLYLRDDIFIEPYNKFKAEVSCFSPYLNLPYKLKRYYKSKNQALYFFYKDNLNIINNNENNKNIFSKFILDSKRFLKNNLTKCYNNNQGNIMVAILLGDKSKLDYQIKRDFSLSGISHLLAVSGLHLTILIQTVFSSLKLLRIGNKKAIFISIFFTSFFIALTGFSPSAFRAGLMNIIFFIGLILDREADSLNSLGLALIIILMINPFSALDIGLQLSFAASLGIIIFRPKVYDMIYKPNVNNKNHKIYKVYRYFCDVASVSISALILTTPIIVVAFERLSLVAPLTNMIITPVVEPTLVLIAFTSFLGGINFLTPIYKLFALLSSIGVYIIKGIANIMANLPHSSIPVNKKYIYIWLIFVVLLLVVYKYIIKNRNIVKYIGLFSLIIFLFGKLSNDIFNSQDVFCENIGDLSDNYVISDSKSAVLVLNKNDKYLIPNIDDVINKYGIKCLNYVVIGSDLDINNVMKIITVYKPYKLISNNEMISLINDLSTNRKNNLKKVDIKDKTYIMQKNIFVTKKTLLKTINKNNLIISNKSGKLCVLDYNE